MTGEKILVTGATGQVAGPLARALAREHEVWVAARFGRRGARERLEAEGLRCASIDLARGDFEALPRDFDRVLHFAVARSAEADFEADLRANAEGVGLLMSHCRKARSFFHCSTSGVYAPAGESLLREDSPLGDSHRVLMPTYSLAKIAAETVVRTMARELGLPSVIARLNTPYGDHCGWPLFHYRMLQRGLAIPVHRSGESRYTLIHQDDLLRTLPGLVEAAAVPALTLNWCGQEHVSIEEWCSTMAELTGCELRLEPTEQTLESVVTDNARMRALVGPARVPWREGIRRLVEAQQGAAEAG